MIAGLETPTSGEILIGGQVVNDLSPRERRIAMVFQSYALYPHLSVYKNIAFPLKAQNVKKELHKEKVEWAASLLGIARSSIASRASFPEVSGRESRWPAPIVRELPFFLLDEPLSNLDAKLRPPPAKSLSAFIAVCVPRPSTSRMINGGHGHGRTVSWCSTKASFASSALPPMSMTIP